MDMQSPGQPQQANSPLRWAADLSGGSQSVFWLTAATFVFLVIVGLLALVTLSRQIDSLREARADSNRARDMLGEVQQVLATLQDAETGQRGFILTGDEVFLEPYEHARSTLEQRLSRLGSLVHEASGKAVFARLRGSAAEQMRYFSRTIELQRTGSHAAAVALIQSREGKQRMDRLRADLAELYAQDERLLASKNQVLEERSHRTRQSMWTGLIAAAVLAALAGALLLRHLRRRLKAESAANAANALMRGTLESVSQGICVWDAELRLAAWNDRFAVLRGVAPEAMRAGMTPEDLIEQLPHVPESSHPAKVRRGALVDMIRTQTPFDVERVRRDGVVLDVRGRPMPKGYYIVTVADITGVRASEANYRDQAVRLSSILDNIVDAIVTINESGSIESWSKGAERLLGYQAEDVLRRNVSMLMPEPHSSAHDDYVRRYIATGERRIIGSRRELEAQHKDGYRVPIELGVSEMRLGKRRLFVGVLRDISDRMEVERLKAAFISTVSHELRTPLTSISGSLGLLAGGATGELSTKAKRLVDIAQANSQRLVRLINDILDLEKAEAGNLAFNLEVLELRSIVEQAIETMLPFAEPFRVRLTMLPGDWDVRVLVDRDRLIQVFTNLISNATKFSPQGESVELAAHAEGEVVKVSVRDRGPGIPVEFRPRLFQRFAQADSSDSRSRGGTGLGLSIAKAMIERLGGHIHFTSEPGAGTLFCVSLPLYDAREPVHPEIPESTAANDARVLVCEDDPDVAVVLCDVLRKAGMHADAVITALEARSALSGGRYDLAIVDLHLPDMDGVDLIAELRRTEATQALPVIVITAAAPGNEAESLRVLHLADWLQKPIDPQRLLRSIHGALAVKKQGRARILHVEDDVPLTLLVSELLSDDADVIAAHSVQEAQQRVQQETFDLIILDVSLADGSGLNMLNALRQPEGTTPPVILYSATEPSREISQLVEAALVKSRDSVEQLLRSVRALTHARER